MENVLQTFQEGQKPMENSIPPNQTETEVIGDSNAVQKTQVNNTDSSVKPQLETVPEPSNNQTNVSIDTVQSSKSIKKYKKPAI